MLSVVKESFHTQLKIVYDKLTGAQNELARTHRETDQSKSLVRPHALPDSTSSHGTTTEKSISSEVLEHTGTQTVGVPSGLQQFKCLVTEYVWEKNE